MAVETPGRPPENPEDQLPEDSVLDLEEYLAMYAAVGQPIRYEILYRLVHVGEQRPIDLEGAIDVDDSTLHYHLNELQAVGLIGKRARTERGEQRQEVYYEPTVYGEVTLTEGVDELIRGEQAFEDLYAAE